MSTICEEFDLRIKNEEVTGTCDWIRGIEWEERKTIREHLESLSVENYTAKQRLILRFASNIYTSVLRVKELDLNIDQLDQVDIQELKSFYGLDNPEQCYQEIKGRIASPESFMTRIPYSVIRELYNRGEVPLDRQIFVACLVRFNVWHGSSYSKALKEDIKEQFYSFFPQDDFSIDILMGVFEMELGVDSAFYMEREFNIGAIIIELVTSGRIPRETIQQKIFDAFNNPLLKQTTHGWAKNIYRDLVFSVEENIACQDQLIQLMYNDRNLLVNFGLGELKKIAANKSFNWDLFISSLDGIVYSEKLTGGLKTALGMLYKGLSKNKSLVEQSCINLAPIFLQEDNKVQQAAQKCFELLTEPSETVTEALLPFLDTMHTEVKAGLSMLIGDEQTEVSYEVYQQKTYLPESCVDQNKIKYIDNEDDFIFLTSKVIKSNDALDYELFLEGILRYYTLKETDPKALKPALKQAKRITDEVYLDITARTGVHHVMAAQLIDMWLSPDQTTVEMIVQEWERKMKEEDRFEYSAKRWFALFNRFKRIAFIINQIHNKSVLPLLSTPTHNDFDIDSTIFFQRLEQYTAKKQTPDETDFCLALCRLNRNTKTVLDNFSEVSEHKEIINYLFDSKAEINPKQIKKLNSIWQTAFLIKHPNQSIDVLLAGNNKQNWLESTSNWNWEMGREYSEGGKYTWATLDLNFNRREVRELETSKNTYFEYHLTNREFIIADVSHWFSRDGYSQDPLYYNIILQSFRYLSELEADETKTVLEVVKYSANHPVPLSQAGYLFLVLSLFCSNKTIRMGAFDWLSLLIDQNNLNLEELALTSSKMISNEAHPIPTPRIVEQFDRLLQMQGAYVDVLHQILEVSLGKIITDNLPKGFSKILHHYYEVLQVTKTPIPENIVVKLEEMKQVSAVKKEVKKLLVSGGEVES